MFGMQPAFTCSKLTVNTIEETVDYFKVNSKDARTKPIDAV